MKFSQTERGGSNFSASSRGDKKFNSLSSRFYHTPRELKNDNSLTSLLALFQGVYICAHPVISTAVVTQMPFSRKTRRS